MRANHPAAHEAARPEELVTSMQTARRIAAIPPYLFAEIDRKIAAKRAQGVDVITFAVGDPDLPTPDLVVEALAEAARDPATHQYPSYFGLPAFRDAVAAFYQRRFGVTLDPGSQVLPLIGSKEGIAHLPWAFVDPGDAVLVTEPGYPVYEVGTLLAGGEPVHLPLRADEGWFPRFERVDPAVADRAKLLWLGYPSNPTAAVATLEQLETAVRFAADHDLLLAHDNAYSEITYDGFVAPSVLQVPGAAEVAVEFGSLSKTCNMTGWRIGWVVGSPVAIEALGRVKTNIDSGIFNAVQRAGVAALDSGLPHLPGLVATYQRRRDRVMEVFWEAGWKVEAPRGALYVWLPTPPGESSVAFTSRLLDDAGVVVVPGTGYGPSGEGYVRLSLTVPDDRLEEGCERVRKALLAR
jgi:LL-diaminopimelate aminotransferase